MSTTRMRLGALVTAGVLSFGLAACGSDDEGSDPTPSAAVGTADDTQDAAGGETTTGTTEDTTGTEGSTATDGGSDGGSAQPGEQITVPEFMALVQEPGEETLSRYTMVMDMEIDGQQNLIEGAVDLSGDSPRMLVSMSMPDLGSIEMIFIDGDAYMSMPGLTPEGTYLLASSEMLGESADVDDLDVSTQWELWEQGAQEVRYLGEEDVDGTSMRRYELVLDPAAVEAALLGDGASATSPGEQQPIVYTVWLDGENLMRVMSFDIGGEAFEMRMDNWGEAVDIEAPDPANVMDMGDMNMDDLGG